MQLYIGKKHIFTVADHSLSLFNLNYSYLDGGTHVFFVDDSAVSIQHLPTSLEGDLSCHIRIGEWICTAKRLPFTNWYKITLVEPLYDKRYVTPLDEYDF